MNSTTRFETTIGDLICAITDAAEESQISAEELPLLTQYLLSSMVEEQIYLH